MLHLRSFQGTRTVLVIRLECDGATAKLVKVNGLVPQMRPEALPAKDITGIAGTIDTKRIIEVVAAYANLSVTKYKLTPEIVAISCPGTVDRGCRVITKSSRLGILEMFECADLLHSGHSLKAFLFNDAASTARGEFRQLGVNQLPDNAAFITVGHGVGSALRINGHFSLGAGAGGHIGRMVINPAGPMSERFNQFGTLESYASLSGLAERLVGEAKDEAQKTTGADLRRSPYFRFRQVLSTLKRYDDLAITDLADAFNQGDPLVVDSINDAARCLGQALSNIVTIINPSHIILGGELMRSIPAYYDRTVAFTRRYCSNVTWKLTTITKAVLGSDAQYLGAAELAIERLLAESAQNG